jgi:hypothetical protein
MIRAKNLLLSAVAASSLALAGLALAADDMTGVLIDNTCGAKQKDEASAAKHPMACAKKDACAGSGYQLIVGDKHYKLTDKGNEQAKAYLAKGDSTHVTVKGKLDGETLDATSIMAAPAAKKS